MTKNRYRVIFSGGKLSFLPRNWRTFIVYLTEGEKYAAWPFIAELAGKGITIEFTVSNP